MKKEETRTGKDKRLKKKQEINTVTAVLVEQN